MKLILLIACVVFSLLTPRDAFAACDEKAATVVTNAMNEQLAKLVGFTMVQCVPSQEAGKCSILCITTSLESYDNVSILLVAISGSAAVNMRKVGVAKFARVSFADKNLLQQRRYLSASAEQVDRFQAAMSRSSDSPKELMAKVRREYGEKAIPESDKKAPR